MTVDPAVAKIADDHGIVAPAEVEALAAAIRCASDAYGAAWEDREYDVPDTMDAVADYLARAHEALAANQEGNHPALERSGVEPTTFYDALRDLIAKARAAARPPRRGRRPNAAVRAAVAVLADFWADRLGKKLTQEFHKGTPVSAAAQFVSACVALFAPEAVQGVERAMMERIRNRRRVT